MHRRALLVSVGALSAGCLGARPQRSSDPTSTPGKTDNPTQTSSCSGSTESTATGANAESGTGEYRVTALGSSATTDGPSFEYVLEPTKFYSAGAVENEEEETGEDLVVKDVSAIEDDAVREAIVTAIRTGSWSSNTLPDGLADIVERVDFFKGASEDETHTHVGLTLHHLDPDRPPAIEFSATVIDDVVSPESPGAIELALKNTASTARSVFSGTVPPFGMVTTKVVEGDDKFLLWRNYEEEGCITFDEEGWFRRHRHLDGTPVR